MASRPSSAAEIIPKPSLGQYVFTEKLGSGTYATVYKAYRKTGVREVVAIKCVLKSSLNKASTENLLTEIELLKNLKHEHIVTLKDFQWDSNYIYLIMEYCCGGDLSRFIRSKRALPEHIVKRFLQQIASAMFFLWSNNVAHMDLKPQNILLTSLTSPQIKLADFGFAKTLYDGDSMHVMRGSPLYMAPEIICSGTYDNRVDLWSIGVILFECLFGKPPFASKSFKELGAKIWDQKEVEIPSGFNVGDNARDLTLRLLQRDPSKRITFEEFFAHPFVDIEHIPSKDSLPKAIKLIDMAVKKDQEENYKAAVRLYCEALDFFMPAIHYEKNSQKKEALRAKIKQYMNRAETLKQLVKSQVYSKPPHQPTVKLSDFKSSSSRPTSGSKTSNSSPNSKIEDSSFSTLHKSSKENSTSISSKSKTDEPSTCLTPKSQNEENTTSTPVTPKTNSLTSFDEASPGNDESPTYIRSMSTEALEELRSLCADSQELEAVIKLINAALLEEQEEKLEQCLHHYELALGAVLKLLPAEPKGRRKDLLKAQVTKWMDQAEKIKSYLDIRNLNTCDTSAEEEAFEMDHLSDSKQCCVQ